MASQHNSCSHLSDIAPSLAPPRLSQQVHREECTLCFDGQDDPEGVLVCLQCFNGGCFAEGRRHAYLHYERTKHSVGLVVKRTRKEQKKRDSLEPPLKKLAITAPSEEDLYSYSTHLVCFACSPVGEAIHSDDAKLVETVSGIMSAISSAQQSEVKAWEEEILACEHSLTLEQVPLINPDDPQSSFADMAVPTQCTECDLRANLWLCLTCGLANCGRKQFGGADGNSHALRHKEETGHNVAVKLGTITPEGTADVYCYACDDSKLDPELPNHLNTLGMKVAGMSKTEKTMTELNIDHNLKFDFSMTGDDGKELQPVFGEGMTGLRNLGNSCYMASVLQTLLSLPAFRTRYSPDTLSSHAQTCDKLLPAECIECQMLKLSDGLLSGRYSHVARSPPISFGEHDTSHAESPKFQEGVRPAQFKSLIGKGHEEFATMRQQDSEEFLQHLLDRLRGEAKRQGRDVRAEPTEGLRFAMEQRLQCGGCKRVGYREEVIDLASLPVQAVDLGKDDEGKQTWERQELKGSLEALCAEEELEGYACSHCEGKTTAIKTTKFKTFPDVLVLHMKKFQLVNWVPTKLEIPVEVPDHLTLDSYLSQGRQADEEELDTDAPQGPDVDAAAVSQLEAMGFPPVRCQKALLATGNNGAEIAMGWLFEHMDDPDIDDPIPAAVPSAAASPGPSAEQIAMIADMGFTANQARKALRESADNTERAIEWLFSNPTDPGEDAAAAASVPTSSTAITPGSARLPAQYRLKAFISHKGPSVHSGHYVSTIRQPQAGLDVQGPASGGGEAEWVLFNDEKVVRAPERGGEEMRGLAYLYVYERV